MDAQIFCGPWVVLDAANRQVMRVSTVEEAQRCVAAGTRGARTYAGHVQPHIVAIDIDVDDPRLARYVTEELAGWAQRHGRWELTRHSGRPSHRHILICPGNDKDNLLNLVQLLREERKIGAHQLDVRHTLRPLGAPHRSGLHTQLSRTPSGADVAATAPPAQAPLASVTMLRYPAPVGGEITDTIRRVTTHCKTGTDKTASGREFAYTRAIKDAGEPVENAWAYLVSLNGKSATKGYQWWRRHMWDKVTPPPRRATDEASATIIPALLAARAYWTDLPTRSRHSTETVGWALLERLSHDTWTAVSERDLQLTTGLARRTIRAALHRLHTAGVVHRLRSPRPEDAHQWKLPQMNSPASLTTPPMLTPPASTWIPTSPPGTATALLDRAAGPSPARPGSPTSTRQKTLDHQRNTAADKILTGCRPAAGLKKVRARILATITNERDRFYATVRAAREGWNKARNEAIGRDHARYRTWWQQLSLHEKHQRRQERSLYLQKCTPAKRTTIKHHKRICDEQHTPHMLTNYAVTHTSHIRRHIHAGMSLVTGRLHATRPNAP